MTLQVRCTSYESTESFRFPCQPIRLAAAISSERLCLWQIDFAVRADLAHVAAWVRTKRRGTSLWQFDRVGSLYITSEHGSIFDYCDIHYGAELSSPCRQASEAYLRFETTVDFGTPGIRGNMPTCRMLTRAGLLSARSRVLPARRCTVFAPQYSLWSLVPGHAICWGAHLTYAPEPSGAPRH